jgi:hypothetical protein
LDGPMPPRLDCFCSEVLKQIQQRGDVSERQAQKLAIGCLNSIAAKYRNNTKGDYHVAESLNLLAPQVPSLLNYIAGISMKDFKEYEDLWDLKTDLAKNARALDFEVEKGINHLFEKSIAECICKATYLKMDILTLEGGVDWRGISPWAFELVAEAFARSVINSQLSRDSKLMSLVHESKIVLSTIGGFNSILGFSQNNTNDVAMGALRLNTKIWELLASSVN